MDSLLDGILVGGLYTCHATCFVRALPPFVQCAEFGHSTHGSRFLFLSWDIQFLDECQLAIIIMAKQDWHVIMACGDKLQNKVYFPEEHTVCDVCVICVCVRHVRCVCNVCDVCDVCA